MTTTSEAGGEEVLLTEFFRQATATLENLCCESRLDGQAVSRDALREIVLEKQTECLQTSIDSCFPSTTTDWTVSDLQESLGRCSIKQHSASVQQAMERMNDAARLAYCRLVLYSECVYDESRSSSKRDLISTGANMKYADVLEFCGLCTAAVRLSCVLEHLRKGAPLFENLTQESSSTTMFPQKRLERIQRMFLRALGYDPDYGTREIKRLFYEGSQVDEDEPLRSTFASMAAAMEAVLMEATAAATHDTFFDDDNVTRVVSVTYSEKLIDEETGLEIATMNEDAAPRSETMAEQEESEQLDDSPGLAAAKEQKRREEFRVARQAAVLQQELLGELLSMRDEERDAKLQKAKEVVSDVLQKAMQLPAGPERISFITSLDPNTQRLMAMQKLWDGMLAANGGKPPTIRTQQPSEY
jgi:hypothetical protein